jgi:hypothetical protein
VGRDVGGAALVGQALLVTQDLDSRFRFSHLLGRCGLGGEGKTKRILGVAWRSARFALGGLYGTLGRRGHVAAYFRLRLVGGDRMRVHARVHEGRHGRARSGNLVGENTLCADINRAAGGWSAGISFR